MQNVDNFCYFDSYYYRNYSIGKICLHCSLLYYRRMCYHSMPFEKMERTK